MSLLTRKQIDRLHQVQPTFKDVGGPGRGLGELLNELNARMIDVGTSAVNTLLLAANVADEETVVIGDDVYQVVVVNTDTTANTAGGLWNNTTNPLVLSGALASHGMEVGDLLRVENEIVKVIGVPDEDSLVLSRGRAGTTIAAHADGADIYKAANPAGPGTLSVGMVTTLTPEVFADRLVAEINRREGSSNVVAYDGTDCVAIRSLDSGDVNLACSETLAGSGNAWASEALHDGRHQSKKQLLFQGYIPSAAEVTLGKVILAFPVPVTLVTNVKVIDTAADANSVKAWDGVCTVSGNFVILDNSGDTDWAANDVILVEALGAMEDVVPV